MHLLAPAALAFAATLPVVVLFYLLKRKRVVKLVSSTLLWQRFLAESQASAPFQRLRHHWLLILQLLLLTLAILALARPYFSGATGAGRLLVAVLDASASMQDTDESPSRFEKARREALRLVDSMQASDQMVVLQAAAHTEVKQSPTSDKALLRRALQNCTVTDTSTRLGEALRLAQPLVRNRRDAAVHLFSDGAAGDLSEFENEALTVVYHPVGRRAGNVGIVNLDVRSHPEDPSRRALLVSVANPTTNAVQTGLEVSLDGRLLETRPLDLAPSSTTPLVFGADQRADGVFTVRLTGADDLATDNEASIVSLLPQPARVLLVTRGNRYLEKALASVPTVTLTVAADVTGAPNEFDFSVVDDVLPTAWPAGNLLCVRSAPTNWLQVLGRVETPQIVDWKSAHPLLRFVSFDDVQIGDSLTVKTPAWAAALVESPGSPLILAGEVERRRVVWLAFDTLAGNWPLRVSFPIFIANAVEWLNPAAAYAARFSVRAGEPLRISLPQAVPEARVVLPDGSSRTLAAGAESRELLFGETWRRGTYRVLAGTNRWTYCANLLDGAETDTTPRAELKLGRLVRVGGTTVQPANLEMWRWFAAAGLAFLLFEWWYYHRRTA